jgi:hypothetical protein
MGTYFMESLGTLAAQYDESTGANRDQIFKNEVRKLLPDIKAADKPLRVPENIYSKPDLLKLLAQSIQGGDRKTESGRTFIKLEKGCWSTPDVAVTLANNVLALSANGTNSTPTPELVAGAIVLHNLLADGGQQISASNIDVAKLIEKCAQTARAKISTTLRGSGAGQDDPLRAKLAVMNGILGTTRSVLRTEVLQHVATAGRPSN